MKRLTYWPFVIFIFTISLFACKSSEKSNEELATGSWTMKIVSLLNGNGIREQTSVSNKFVLSSDHTYSLNFDGIEYKGTWSWAEEQHQTVQGQILKYFYLTLQQTNAATAGVLNYASLKYTVLVLDDHNMQISSDAISTQPSFSFTK